jgi:NAD(P)-dependent dehydrogenase (short-subunit alcohol dehydrogenase family)
VSRVEKETGRLDILVHCAGVMAALHKPDFTIPDDGSIDEAQKMMLAETEQDWATQFSVNVTAVYFVTASFLPLLKKSNGYWEENQRAATSDSQDDTAPEPTRTAQVITTTGIAAYMRSFSMCMGYSASKAATQHLMKTMTTTFAPANIRFVRFIELRWRGPSC